MIRSDGYVKKILIPLMIATFTMQAAPVLVEAYQEGQITIPAESFTTDTACALTFSVDTSCVVSFSTSGNLSGCKAWLAIDNDSLPPLSQDNEDNGSVAFTYSYIIQPGEHTAYYTILGGYNPGTSISSTFRNGYLQALIFLPDTGNGAVTEQEHEALPDVAPSVISSGPYVSAPGATQVVDASGRVLEGVLTDGKVYLSDLPPGTYFARQGERTVTKVVKVE